MSSRSVLKALSAVAGVPLKYFTLVRSTLRNEPGELYYLCFGKYSLFLIDREMNGDVGGGMRYACPYSCLERCEAELEDPEIFAVYVMPGVPLCPETRPEADPSAAPQGECFPEQVIFASTDREKLLVEFETFFRTDYMFQHWQLPASPFVVDVKGQLAFDAEGRGGRRRLLSAPTPDSVTDMFGNYMFFKPKGFERQSSAGRRSVVARYVDTSDTFGTSSGSATAFPDMIEVHLFETYPIDKDRFSLTIGGEKQVNEVAEHFVREFGSQVVDYRVIGVPQRYKKKTNLTDDIAQFECWQAHIRTAGGRHNSVKSQALANRDICILVLQRKYIPPMMDKFQNIVVIGFSRFNPLARSQQNVARIEALADSLSFNSRSYTCDLLVVQTKANALMLDEESYAWYAANLRVFPEAISLARAFTGSIVKMLRKVGVAVSVGADLEAKDVGDDPLDYSLRLENQVPVVLSKESSEVLVREWKVRVWRYLAFCVDGGLDPGLTIAGIASNVLRHPRRLQRLSQILQMLLHFRAAGQEYKQLALPLKIADERLMRNFTFNEAVMEQLLSSGYVKRVLDDTSDPLEYPRFIVRLLQRGRDRERWGYSLQYTVCKQLARSSAVLGGALDSEAAAGAHDGSAQDAMRDAKSSYLSELALHTIVPALIDLLNDAGSNDKIQVLVVSTLVNFTKNNTIIKNKVMAGGAIRRICRFLHSKHDDLVRHSCSLLNNCTKSEQYRAQVAKFKAVEALMRLLKRNPYPPHYRSSRILVQACAVVGNLASDTRLRQRITDALGYEVESDSKFKGSRFEQARSIRVLVDLLLDKFAELHAQRDSLRVTVIFALKNLAIRHEENKRTIGRLATEALLNVVEHSPDDDKNRILVDVALRCIYVLSFERSNCKIMQRLNLEKILQARQASFPEITRQIQLKMNKTT